MSQCVLTDMNARRADHRGPTPPTDESAQPLPTLWVYLHDRSITITLTRASIERDITTTTDEEAKTLIRRLAQQAVRLTTRNSILSPEEQDVVQEISAFVDNLDDLPFRAKVLDPKQRFDHDRGDGPGLIDIIDEVLANESYVFGPSSQKPGDVGPASKDPEEAKANCRMICIFCHAVYTRTSDLKRDLRKNHIRQGVDIQGRDLNLVDTQDLQTLFRPKEGEPNRLRAFGKFSYEDVKSNNWDIKDWTSSTPRTPKVMDNASSMSKSRKRSRETIAEDFEVVGPRRRARSTATTGNGNFPYSANQRHQPRTSSFNQSPFDSALAHSTTSETGYRNRTNEDLEMIDPAILTDDSPTQAAQPRPSDDLLGIGSQHVENRTLTTVLSALRLARQPSYRNDRLAPRPPDTGSNDWS